MQLKFKKSKSPIALLAFATFAICSPAFAQPGGDLEKQRPHWKIDKIPPAPVLLPADAMKSFKLPPGFKIELVAAEPFVEEPIAMTFDPDGRIYVVELRGYMPDAQGTGELEPVGRVSILESTKKDGVYDKHTVFLDKLVAPRSISLVADGVLIAEPPNLWLCKDTNGDGKADTKDLVASDYGSRQPNPEHMANGLVWMMDNWCYSANSAVRFRYTKGKLVRDGTVSRGQWGISQDDTGRLFYNSNSSMLRTDLVPAQYLTRNPYLPSPFGVNYSVASNEVYTSRVNPGVNRGYTKVLGVDGYLKTVTAACGPQIYRGDIFPPDYHGNAFVAEPSGNVIIRHILKQNGLEVKGESVQHAGGPGLPEEVDFLTSQDERFRPVSLYNGPDGALYIVDLYHGILQHKAYLSAYLHDQVKQRDLDKNEGHRGRIWRVVPEKAPSPAERTKQWPQLAKAPTADLVKTLSHTNGWWRDTAQRLLVERQDMTAVTPLTKLANDAAAPTLARVHAIWTLQGLERLEDEVVGPLLKAKDAQVRLQVLRAAELLVRKRTGLETVAALPDLANDPSPEVQLQVLAYSAPELPELQKAANGILARKLSDKTFRSAALSAAAGRELELLQSLIADETFGKAPETSKRDLYNDLAESVIRGRSADRIEKLLALIAELPPAKKADKLAMMAGVSEAVAPDPKTKVLKRKLRLPAEPAGLAKLRADEDKKIATYAVATDAGLSWPNKPGDTTPPLKPLTPTEQALFEAGRTHYAALCGVCHQPSGLGMEGVAPPLVDSEWVLGSVEKPARIVIHGLTGPIKIGKRTFDSEMPGLAALPDDQIAAILTYVRREWGHESSAVDPKQIAKIRADTKDRGERQWTAEELMKLK